MPTPTTTDLTAFEPTVPDLGAERVQQWHDVALTDAATARLRELDTHGDAELATFEQLGLELFASISEHGPLQGLQAFFHAAVGYGDALDRFATVHTIEQLEGLRPSRGQRKGVRPMPFPGWKNPVDVDRHKRLLRPLEMALVRLVALDRSRQHTAVVAFGEAGAVTGELVQITAGLVDSDKHEILLPGGVDGLDERCATIPHWAAPAVGVLVEARPNAKVLLYSGMSDDPAKVQAALGMAATNVFRDAGLAGDPGVSFYSLRYTSARSILDACGTDAAVEFLGESNYSLVREKLGMAPARPQRARGN